MAQLNNPHNFLCFVPFPSGFSDSQWQQFPKCFQCGSTRMLNLISLLQIHGYSCSDSRATFLRRTRLKPANNSSRVVSAAAHIGTHLGRWDKLNNNICRKHCCRKLRSVQLGCAILLGEIHMTLISVSWKDLDFLKRKKVFHSYASRWINYFGMN